MERHFVSRGRPTLVVPPQVDRADFADPAPPSLDDGLRLLYAGSAGAKDQLAVVLEGIRRLAPDDRARVHLAIAGISREQAGRLSDLEEAGPADLDDQVSFLGRIRGTGCSPSCAGHTSRSWSARRSDTRRRASRPRCRRA
ncbi:hypothetical protein GCM10027614_74010 [Micromonospora vulcania]